MVYAQPIVRIVVMGVEDDVEIIYKYELKRSADSEYVRLEKIREYNVPYIVAKLGIADEVISPEETRKI